MILFRKELRKRSSRLHEMRNGEFKFYLSLTCILSTLLMLNMLVKFSKITFVINIVKSFYDAR